MLYKVELKPRALRDIKSLQAADRARVIGKLEALRNNLAGDVKRLSNLEPAYRLRVGAFRVLFEVAGNRAIIYRVKHRKDAYREW